MKRAINVINAEIKPSHFGDYLEFDMPEGATCVILCGWNNTGLKPFSIRLTHQIYIHTLEEYQKEHPENMGFYIVPVRNEEYLQVADLKWV